MKLFTGLLVSALLATGPWVQSTLAQEHSGRMGGKEAGTHIHMLIKHAEDLGLMKEQVTKLKKIDLDFERNRVKTGAEIRVAEMDISAMVEDEKTDLTAIENRLKQKAALGTGLRIAAIKADREALALLTPEQREKAEDMHEEMMEEKHEHMDGMGRGMKEKMGGGHDDSSKKDRGKGEHEDH